MTINKTTTRRLVGILTLPFVLPCCATFDALAEEFSAGVPSGVVGGLQVSVEVLNLMLSREIEDTTLVREQVMRAYTVGNAETAANIAIGLEPNQDRAVFDIQLRGHSDVRDAVAYRGPVTVYSSSRTTIDARKQLLVGDTGLTIEPASASCTTSMRILDVAANRRFVERIGWRRASRLRPQAANLTSQRVARRVETRLDREVETAVNEARASIEKNLGTSWIDSDLPAGRVTFSTTDRHVRIHVSRGQQSRRPAPSRTPKLQIPFDIQLIAHESLVESLLESWLGGQELRDRAFLEWMKTLTGSEPRALWVHSRRPSWSITCAPQPVSVSFAGDHVQVTLHATSIRNGDEQLDGSCGIAVAYRLEITDDGPHLVRLSGPTIRHGTNTAPTEKRQDFTTFLQHKFDAVFPPELYFDGLQPPAGGSWGKLRRYRLTQLSAQGGWFTIGYQDGENS